MDLAAGLRPGFHWIIIFLQVLEHLSNDIGLKRKEVD
jgi:hypothetical protein